MEIIEEIYKIINLMVLENTKNTVEDIMKESGKTAYLTDKEKWNMKMEIFMKESFYKEREMAMDIIQLRIIYMKESGEKDR